MSNDTAILRQEVPADFEQSAVVTRKTWVTPRVIEGTLTQDTNHTPAGTPDHTAAS